MNIVVLIGSTSEKIISEICCCNTPGKDDGDETCFIHHDCSLGNCTHTDGGDEDGN